MTHVLRSGQNLLLVRFEMEVDEFPRYLTRAIGTNGRFAATENLARSLVAGDFQPDESCRFVKAVCLWGSDPRRAGKIIIRNTPRQISAAFRRAYSLSTEGNVVDALKTVMSIEGLAVSFGSKHMKFLDPDRHVVLDTILSDRLGYTRDVEGKGYARWLEACHEYLQVVRSEAIPYAGTGQNGWRVSDIEMAIFNKVCSEKA